MNPAKQAQKKWIFLACILGQITCGSLYLNMASFFPVYVDDKYNKPLKALGKKPVISTFEISLCIVGLELAVMLCTFIHPRTISLMGRKNAIMIGFAVQVITNIVLGLLANCPTD